jgi:hypothetical protein
VKEVDQILDLVRLENIAKGWHGSAAIVYLMLDLLLFQTFTNGTQIRPQVATSAICTVAVLTPPFVKERGSSVFTRGGVNRRSGSL